MNKPTRVVELSRLCDELQERVAMAENENKHLDRLVSAYETLAFRTEQNNKELMGALKQTEKYHEVEAG